MTNHHRPGKIYPRLIACLLAVVLFASFILAGAALWFSKKNEEDLHIRISDNMEAVSSRLSSDVLSLFDLGGLVVGNVLVKENFRPYLEATLNQQYYYSDIIDLLLQSRLQLNGLVDSAFLYADADRVLYSAGEKGMVTSDTFFTRLMTFENMDRADWLDLLESAKMGYEILPPDRYFTNRLSSAHPVIPIAYRTSNHGYPNVLVLNLSLEKMLSLYQTNALFNQTRFAIYSKQGRYLCGWDADLKPAQLSHTGEVRLEGADYYLYSSYQPSLNVTVVSFTPRAAIMEITNYFRFIALALPLVFGFCGIALAIFLSRRMYEPFRVVHESIRPYTGEMPYLSELEAIKTSISALANDRQTYFDKSREHLGRYVSQTLTSLLSGQPLNDEAYFSQLMAEEYGFETTHCRVIDFLLDLAFPASYTSIHEAMKSLSQVLEDIFSARYALVRVRLQENMYVLIVNEPREETAELEDCCRQAAERIARWAGISASVRWGIGGRVQQFSELPESFDQANSAVFALPVGGDLSDMPETPEDFHYDRRDIVSALSTCDVKLVEAAFTEILSQAKRCRLPYPQAAAVLKDMLSTAAGFKQKLSPNTPMPQASIDPLLVLLLSPDINTAPLVSALLPHIPTPMQTRDNDGMERIALRLKTYIDANYNRELSLDILADALGLSAKYLSRVFKQILGVNLSDYLAYVRVEKIKELLLTPMTLDQIAQQTGITNRTTFTRTFRKLEGMTPSEWRRLHQDTLVKADNK